MTEIETRIGHKTPPVSSAREKPQESKQTATPPLGATEKRQEPVVSEDTVRDSPTAREKPQKKEQMATQPSGATEKRQEAVVSEDTARDSKKTGALVQAAKAIEEGAELVGEKAPVIASTVFHSIKKGVSVAYGTSSTLVGGGLSRRKRLCG